VGLILWKNPLKKNSSENTGPKKQPAILKRPAG